VALSTINQTKPNHKKELNFNIQVNQYGDEPAIAKQAAAATTEYNMMISVYSSCLFIL
jgi:hypothetical protein